MYELLKTEGRAKRGRFHTPHGVIETPVFMNVGTVAAIKGAVSTEDLEIPNRTGLNVAGVFPDNKASLFIFVIFVNDN